MDASLLPAGLGLDLLEEAWRRVRTRGGSPGVDGIDISGFEGDLTANLQAILVDASAGVYQPQAYRGVEIAKAGGGHRRIVIGTVRDRVFQAAAMLLLLPRVEGILHPCSFAYRRGIGVHDALAKVAEYRDRGLRHVLCGDIERFFDRVPHAQLLAQLGQVCDDVCLNRLVRLWLTAPVVDGSNRLASVSGLPQGLPISPLLANLYLTPFDRRVVEAGWKLVRYADDFIICCPDAPAVALAHEECRKALAGLELQLAEDKTCTATFESGFEFLGARFSKEDLIPAVAHPYEADFAPPPRPAKRSPKQALPHKLMRTLYLQQQGSSLGCHGGRLVVSRGNTTILDIAAHHIDQIFIFGRINITTPAMTFCLESEIPIHLFSGKGRYFGLIRRMADTNFALRRAQFDSAGDPARCLVFARAVVRAKISNDRNLLQHHLRNHPETDLTEFLDSLASALDRVPQAEDMAQLRGIEGNAAAVFYRGFARCLRGDLTFLHRTRRPPTDPVNSLLSFGYTMLFHNVYSYLTARGLDTALALFHEPGRGHPALASDLVEEFRAPIVDSLVLALVNRGVLSSSDFYLGEGQPQPCLLQDQARVRFIEEFENKMNTVLRHPDVDHEVNWRRIIDLQILRFRRFIEGKVDCYQPYLQE